MQTCQTRFQVFEILSDKFLTIFSRLEFINYIPSTSPMSCTSKFFSYMTMTHFFIITTSEFFTNPANVTQLELFFFFTQDQIFDKMFIDYFFTILIFFKSYFNKFIDSIFTSKNIYWLGKLIISTNKCVRKTTRNLILIFF